MREVRLPVIGTVPAWRDAARALAREGVAARDVLWRVGNEGGDLFGAAPVATGPGRELTLPKAAIDGIEHALCHSDPERFARAYDIVLRLSDKSLRWGDRSDPAMRQLLEQGKAVGRDIHKMHAFVRFREVDQPGPRRRFAAWFEPDHPIVERATPFFTKRFGDMNWVIATPGLTARFVDGKLDFAETETTTPPPEDATEALWNTYYASIFNPARLMVKAMQAEMPKKYWKNMPETRLIPDLIRGAEARARDMRAAMPTLPPARVAAMARHVPVADGPAPDTPEALRRAIEGCRRCPLHGPATQPVFGEGPMDAPLMIVGEQPGDREDLEGRPFVGPAGALFDRAAREAGLDRKAAYVTNSVKHFKFQPRGKRRIHQKPDAGEVQACKWWLDQERALLRPPLILSMGATALQSLTGDGKGILKRRGRLEQAGDGTPVFVTVHPSYLLRLPDPALKDREYAHFVDDLRAAMSELTARAA